ncbi:hypothetical protein [Streptomyces sp. JJ36]|uniref:hypothetical protein n=1 Tax=Streptomyces sp. JJ36 TaxID=2736645 RepID=UPI001F436AED|nr:hypothetical protein [Streptomyces sp. JJ36]MCF6521868.1 hypothetical protein [Streptomyces sp. JJ36]
MSSRITRLAVAAVALTAATALTAGCSSGGDESGAARKPDGTRTASAAPQEAPGDDRGSGKPDRDGASPAGQESPQRPGKKERGGADDGTAGGGPKVPRAELTPATGTFSKPQKEYLVDRVPRGMDPAAVLEAGQAACDRIRQTADVDRKAAVSALRGGEIPHAEDAVRHLCPRFAPLLKEAGLDG